jgi:L-fuconolactonase
MDVVDLQIHEPGPFMAPDEVVVDDRRQILKEIVRQTMDSVGVTAAVLNPSIDVEFAAELAAESPQQFAIVRTLAAGRPADVVVSPEQADVGERILRAFAEPGVVGIRMIVSSHFAPESVERFKSGGLARALSTCTEHSIPVFLFATGSLEVVDAIAQRYEGLNLVLDHFGLPQPPSYRRDCPPWSQLPDVLALARYPNLSLKVCGAPALSETSFPYSDVWRNVVSRVLEAYGSSRLAWASDISRFRGREWSRSTQGVQLDYPGAHNYMESLAFFLYSDELSDADKRNILGATARRILNWYPRDPA